MACAMDRGAVTGDAAGRDAALTVDNRPSMPAKRKRTRLPLTVVLTRLVNLFQTIDKLSTGRVSTRLGGDDVQQLRYTVSKLLQYVTGQERIHRDIIMKNSAYMDQLLTTLECCGDTNTQQNIVIILHELVGKAHTSKRVSTLVAHGATHALLSVMVEESREQQASMDLLISIHQLLGKLGPKDRKFAVKARLSQALPVTLNLVRSCINNAKPLQALLHVLKLYSSNAVNASYLGKNGTVTHLFKIINVCGKKHLTLLKYTLDTLSLLVKSKSNSARAIGQGGVPVLLNMFFDWHRLDTKNRHLTLRKAVLHVLKHITNLKSGRKAFMDADGIRILYTACQDAIDCRESESIIVLSSHIMRKCFPKNRLAVASLRSTVTFPLPASSFHVIDTGEGQEVAESATTTHHHLPSRFRAPPPGEEEYESSLDNDDDVSSDEDRNSNKNLDSEDETDSDLPTGSPYHRTWEDLLMYKPFFPELHEFDAILEDNEMPMPQDNKPIVIPTGTPDSGRLRQTGLRTSQSASVLFAGNKCTIPTRNSSPNIAGFSAPGISLRDAMDNLNLGLGARQDSAESGPSPQQQGRGHHHQGRARLKSMFSPTDACSSDSSMESTQPLPPPPSAVNLKTGSSIFSLDITSKSSSSSSSSSSAQLKSRSRGLRGSLSSSMPSSSSSGAVSASHEKRSRPSTRPPAKADDWLGLEPTTLYSPPTGSQVEQQQQPTGTEEEEEQEDLGYVSPEVYLEISSQTTSAGRYSKVAYPDMYGHVPPPYREPLHDKKFGIQRAKVFEDIDRFINPDQILDRVVYDLDLIVSSAGPTYTHEYSNHSNRDEMRVGKKDESVDHLKFNSQFESGNLRKAVQVRQYEYDLILSPDVNTNHHHQWFYFEVSNMEAGMPYRFNIVNCEKLNSQFNFGMRPVMFSVAEAMRGRPHWIRAGTEICYYKNHFIRSTRTTGGVRGKSYYTATFTLNFKHECDVVYLAYHYPYTYTMLQAHLYSLEQMYDSSQIYFKNQTLCSTLGGNRVPVITITNHPPSYDREGIDVIKTRQYVFLSSRVHPGESNASWVMKGTIQYLLSSEPLAQALRDAYIFKIVPMLNPDGVINGTHRCSLVAEDLNRRWMQPCPKLHPTIYHTKGLLQYLAFMNKSPVVFCDYHGHSRRKNVFLYGCSPHQSWMNEDLDNPAVTGNKVDDNAYKTLPRVLQTLAPAFSLTNCSFMVEKSKEATARVVVWRQIGIVRSYTMESSYCGCDQGPYKNMHLSTGELEEMGQKFCEALIKVKSRHYRPNAAPTFSTQESTSHTRREADSELEEGGLGEGGGGGEKQFPTEEDVVDEEEEDVEEEEDGTDDCDAVVSSSKLVDGARGGLPDEDRLTFQSSNSSSSSSEEQEEGDDLDDEDAFD